MRSETVFIIIPDVLNAITRPDKTWYVVADGIQM